MAYYYYLLPTLLFFVLIRKFQEYNWKYCKNKVRLDDKVVVITGANSGIGYEVAKDLAKRGAKVIIACRDIKKAQKAIEKIKCTLASCNLICMQLDLASLKSVKSFAEELNKQENKIDILIINAGVSYPKGINFRTEDDFEIHFGVNHLGHFLLTNLLLPKLKNAAPSKIIVVTSLLHEKGSIDLTDLNKTREDCYEKAYGDSKLANAYFAQELAAKVKNDKVNIYAACPGWVYSGLFRNHNVKWYHYILVSPIAFFFMRTPKQGAQTIIYCATEPKLENETGLFYRNCDQYKSKYKFDSKVATELWYQSEELIKSKVKLD